MTVRKPLNRDVATYGGAYAPLLPNPSCRVTQRTGSTAARRLPPLRSTQCTSTSSHLHRLFVTLCPGTAPATLTASSAASTRSAATSCSPSRKCRFSGTLPPKQQKQPPLLTANSPQPPLHQHPSLLLSHQIPPAILNQPTSTFPPSCPRRRRCLPAKRSTQSPGAPPPLGSACCSCAFHQTRNGA